MSPSLKAGQRVATIDLDCRQQSFTRYIDNRSAWARRAGLDLELPVHRCIKLGETMQILVGRRLGLRFLRRYGRYIRLDKDRLLIGRYLFFGMGTPSCSLGVSLQCCEYLRLCCGRQ
jgi:hypothetical protein